MRVTSRGPGYFKVSLSAVLCLSSGQMCTEPVPPPGDPVETNPIQPMMTACGLFASDCVALQGTSPQAMAGGDFDRDGDLDLIVVNAGTNNITVLLNDGTATFTADRNYAVGDGPGSIAAGDFDGDGDLDLAVMAELTVVTLRNRGDATFEPAVDLGLGVGIQNLPIEIEAADLDGDGDLDLATANVFPDSVNLLLNDGSGTFTVGLAFAGEAADVPVLPQIAAGDLAGDELLDLLFTRFSGDVSIMTNLGSATFGPPSDVAISEGHYLNDLLLTDLDGDGDQDLVVADDGEPPYTTDPGSLVLLFNQGDGTFGGLTRLDTGQVPNSVAAADFDGDGDPDLAVTNELSDTVSVVVNRGSGTFVVTRTLAVGDGPVFVVAADLDGDGDVDLATANMHSNSVAVLLNDGAGNFTPGG